MKIKKKSKHNQIKIKEIKKKIKKNQKNQKLIKKQIKGWILDCHFWFIWNCVCAIFKKWDF